MKRPPVELVGCLLLAPRILASQCPEGTPPPCHEATARTAPAPRSVAVLYFATRDTADAYLADGLTEDIATSLGRVARVHVKAPSTVRRLQRRMPGDVRGIGRALGVRYVLDGGVRRTGAGFRVAIRLLNAESEIATWGQTYDRTADQLLDLPAEVAQVVATTVAGELAPNERASVMSRPTRDPLAYDHLLRGNFFLAKRTAASTARAIADYGQAVRRDSGLTSALARIGYAYGLLLYYGWPYRDLPRESLLARGADASSGAIRQDSTSSDAWLARAQLLISQDPRGYSGALAAVERALAIDPRNADAWHAYGSSLRDLGRDSAADVAYHRAIAIDADRPITLHGLAILALQRGRRDEALVWMDSALTVDPDFVLALAHRARLLAVQGRLPEARRDLAHADRVAPDDPNVLATHAVVAAAAGDTLTARGYAERATTSFARTVPSAVDAVQVIQGFIAVGNREQALVFLERARPRGALLWSLTRGSIFDPIRDDARFQRIMDDSRPPGVP